MNISKACFLAGLILWSITAGAQHNVVDSLNTLIKSNEISDSLRIEAIVELSSVLRYTDYEQALTVNNKALSESKKSRLTSTEASAYITRALIHSQAGNLDSAKLFCNKAITLSESINDDLHMALAYNVLGSVNLSQGNYANALRAYMDGLERFRSISHESGTAATLNRIGNFYLKRKQYNSSRLYYEQSLSVFEKLNRQDQVTGILNNIGVSYYQENNFTRALEYFSKSTEILEEIDMPEKLAIRELNIGKTNTHLEKYHEADLYLKKSLEHARQYNDKKVMCQSLLNLGILKRLQHENATAITYLEEGLKLTRSMHDHDTEIEFYETIAKSYAQLNNYEQAYAYYQKFDLLKDSLLNLEKDREVLILQNQFEAKQNEQKISLLQHEAEKKNIILLALILGSILLILSMVLVLINYNNKQRSLRLIHTQKEEISRQKITELLKDQELNSVKNKLEGQENERKRIAQELHDGIGGTLASIKMNLLGLKTGDGSLKERLNDITLRLDNACEEVRMISHNLIPPVLHNSALTEVIKSFVNEVVGTRKIVVNYEFYPKKQIEAIDKNIQVDIYRIIQELVTNAIKHANACEINIYLTMHDDYVNLMVEDDGTGFRNDGKQDGIGLKNIQSRVAALDGKITIDSNIGKGTNVIIDLSLPHDKVIPTHF
ncbi:tetratricopeptide repeat protein [Fulvivirga ulvae]|uniref:tetratricopeptide repeat-containing sensor histidine kinase n=1 Tax=Fulvivirga ulvae TaxID=2904245 RepID=UPI001F2123B3|nr:tetratricopeptide repeat protein [Fulvivirga ulvae]UII30237.1 tetratricopeptide repeat protein [Fulvivirga ulvae]